MKHFFTSLFVLLFCTSGFLFSQVPLKNLNAAVKGQVTDSLTAEPVAYATLRISRSSDSGNVVKAFATDDKGRFNFDMTEAGDYQLEVHYVGKQTFSSQFKVEKNGTIDLGVLSMKEGEHAFSEVVVSAAKPLVMVDLDKITYNIEEDPDSKSNNVLEMLKKVPLVTVDGEENIQLKGSSNFKIYMNGKPSNMISSNPKEVLKSMPANTVKDIQIITDPGAKYDAEGVTGIINIVTQKQSSLGGYTASLRAGANTLGGFSGGAYLMMKYGKIGFTGNYNYYEYKSPSGGSYSERIDYVNSATRYLREDGTNKYDGSGQYGSGELSFELDTFNLINVAFNRYGGDGVSSSLMMVELRDQDDILQKNYRRDGSSTNEYGSTDFNVDYQRTFQTPDRLFTTSYRFSLSPSDWSNASTVSYLMNDGTPDEQQQQFSEASMKEHTFQVDYTTPFAKIHTLETGLKYILRLNGSNSGTSLFDPSTDIWNEVYSDIDEFEHRSGIASAYGSYSMKLKKWGVKAGLRYEGTDISAIYPLNTDLNFDVPYNHNLVPSATVTYQIKPMQNIRFGYNMRIMRPSISQLNPYVNSFNSNFVSYGNPDLKPVESHSINLNYGYYHPKFNINANASYNFANNSIERITTIDSNGVSNTTYDNIGENKRVNLSSYLSWNPTTKLRIFGNLWGNHVDIRANNNTGLSNNGFSGGLYGGGSYTLPWELRLSAFGGYFGPQISLQGKGSTYSFHNISLNKSFLDKKLDIRLTASNPFQKESRYANYQETTEYKLESVNYYAARQFELSVSYRFGEMKEQIKKTRRGITNDDLMSSGSGEGQQGGSSTGSTQGQ